MIWSILVAVVCLVGCGLMGGLETGIYTLNRVRLAVRAGMGSRSAQRIRNELLHPSRLLATLLVGTNFAHAGLSASITAMLNLEGASPVKAVIANTLIVVPLVFLVDAVPKELFRVFTNSWTYGCSWILVSVRILFSWTGLVPILRGLGDFTSWLLGVKANQGEPERKLILQSLREGHQTGLIGEIQLEMADRIFGLSERPVSECTVAWKRAVSVSVGMNQQAIAGLLRGTAFSRYPVIESSPSGVRVLGVVSGMDLLLHPSTPVAQLAQEPLVIASNTSVLETARRMRAARRTMAIVADGAATVPLGIVTLKDVLEPIVGNTPEW